jgi:hypothetical protein
VPDRRAYINYVTTNKLLHTESALLFVQYEDDPVIMHYCLKELIRRNRDPMGLSMSRIVSLLIEMIENNRLSSRDAVDLLIVESQAAFQALMSMPEADMRDILIAHLRQSMESSLNSNNM